jgi:hypothetical protein
VLRKLEDFYAKNRQLISCTLFATSVITGLTGAPIEAYEAYEAARRGGSWGKALIRSNIGRTYIEISAASFVGMALTGGCF